MLFLFVVIAVVKGMRLVMTDASRGRESIVNRLQMITLHDQTLGSFFDLIVCYSSFVCYSLFCCYSVVGVVIVLLFCYVCVGIRPSEVGHIGWKDLRKDGTIEKEMPPIAQWKYWFAIGTTPKWLILCHKRQTW